MQKALIVLILLLLYIVAFPAPQPAAIIENIHIDQFGYRCGDQKIAVVSSAQTGFYGTPYNPGVGTDQYQVRRWADDAVVFSGTLSAWSLGQTQSQSGDQAWWFDFSSVSTPGAYYIYDLGTGKASYQFSIDNQIYKQVLKQAMRSYYYQRCGSAKTTPYAGTGWTDAACHVGAMQDKDCRLYSNNSPSTSRDLSGGWHDAGDYNKYVGFTLGALTDLLLAYQQNPTIWTDDFDIPESGNGIPDILDEAKYELDWLLKMQQSDGSVLSIVGTTNGPSGSPPSTDQTPRVYGPATTNASFVTANLCALAALQFNKVGDTSYADSLRSAAIRAYGWAVANPAVVFYNTGIIAAGEQEVGAGTYDLFSRQLMAAVYLYQLTADTAYSHFVDSGYQQIHLLLWGYAYPFETAQQDALLNYAAIPGVSPAVKNNIINAYQASMQTGNFDNLPSFLADRDAYRAWLSDQNYTDGSNQTKGHQGSMFINMTYFNLDPSDRTNYINAAAGFLHYMHGVNPTGFCYLTNMGAFGAEKSVPEFYNSWFADGSALWDRVGVSTYGPAPGYVPGGADPSYNTDACCPNGCGSTANNSLCNPSLVTPPLNQPIQKSYKDFNANWPEDSWEVSENGIYYEAAYVRLLSAFMDTSTACSLPVILPDSLISFTAAFQNANLVKTSWLMFAQGSIAKYILQRSPDDIAFDSIGTLPVTSLDQYTYNDNTINADSAWYRLELVDGSGIYSFSDTVKVRFAVTGPLGIYPNPARGMVTAGWTNNEGSKPGIIQLKDLLGRTIYEAPIQMQTGYNSYNIPVSNLAASIYYLLIRDDTHQIMAGKLMKW